MKNYRLLLPLLLLSSALWLTAAPENYVISLNDLPFTEKDAKTTEALAQQYVSYSGHATSIQVRTDLKHKAYLAYCPPPTENNQNNQNRGDYWSVTGEKFQLALTCEKGATVTGWVDFPSAHYKDHKKSAHAFSVDTSKLKPANPEEFQKIRRAHYKNLVNNRIPGTSWFIYQSQDSVPPATTNPNTATSGLDDTYRFAVGGKALAENLALDRELILATNLKEKDVSLDTLQGITVPPFDWKPLLKDIPAPQIDPLAHLIPADQHALFCGGMAPLLNLISTFEQQGVPVLQSFTATNPLKDLPAKYRRQMGLDLPDSLTLLLPVDSVALTGSDPFFPTGTDLAILFESSKSDSLFKSLSATLNAKAKAANAPSVTSAFQDIPYLGFQSRDRTFSAHLAKLGDTVILTNSAAQLTRLLAVYKKQQPSLASTEEFHFFRSRYPLSRPESAFVFISDPTIRRWGSPQLRIAASRRSRAIAALSHLTAASVDQKPLTNDFSPLLGKTKLGAKLVHSELFNTLSFLTPTNELQIKTITAAEAQGYNNWKRGYESGWAKAFDPIGIQLDIQPDSQGIDMTLLPLTIDSEYREFISWTGKANLSQRARTPHAEALTFLSIAIDKDSEPFKQLENSISGMFPDIKVNPFSWLGESISIYLDQSEYWDKLAKSDDPERYLEENLNKLPLGIRIECENPLKLAVFLTSLRGLSESSAPGLLTWQKNEHKGQNYVTIKANKAELGTDLSIFYAPTASALLISLDEKMLLAAIEREQQPLVDKQDIAASPQQFFFNANPNFLYATLFSLNGNSFDATRQSKSWSAIPILNEWKQLHPDSDPVTFYNDRFASPIACPGGKGYRWNAEALTMESVAYGHPAGAKSDPVRVDWLERFSRINSQVNFEHDGLRVRAKLDTPE